MQTNGRGGIPRFSCLLRAIFLIIGAPSLLLAVVSFMALSGKADFSNNRLGTARIIDVKDATANCPYYVVAFTADNGQRVTFEVELCSGEQVGQSVQVMYDPQNPTSLPTVVDLSLSGWYRVAGFAIAGLLCTLLGLLPLRARPKAARSPATT